MGALNFFVFHFQYFFLKLTVVCRLFIIYAREDNNPADSGVNLAPEYNRWFFCVFFISSSYPPHYESRGCQLGTFEHFFSDRPPKFFHICYFSNKSLFHENPISKKFVVIYVLLLIFSYHICITMTIKGKISSNDTQNANFMAIHYPRK